MGDSTTTTGNSDTNQTQVSNPWGPATNAIGQGLNDALWTYNSQLRNNDWTSMFNDAVGGMSSLANNAIATNPLQGSMNEWQSTFGTDGYNQTQRDALAQLQGFSAGQNPNQAIGLLQPFTQQTDNPALAGFTQMAAGGPNYYSEDNLAGIARGDLLNREDPNFERVLDRSLERAATEAALVSGGMGRYGSGAHQGVVTRNIGDTAANARMGQYQFERGQQLQANQLMDAARSARDATQLSALSGQAGTYADDRNSAINAINALGSLDAADQALQYQAITDQFNMGQQGMSNLASAGDVWSSLYGAQQQPYNDLYSLSQTPWNLMSQLMGIAGASSPYGTQTSTSTTDSTSETEKDNTWGTVAGLATLL